MSRQPRFKRAKNIFNIQLTDRDVEIIHHVFKHRFLKSTHILKLVKGSRQGTLRRLQLLYHHGYLDRPRAQLDYFHQGGSKPLVYGLGNRGAELLEKQFLIPKRKTDWTLKNRCATRYYLQHTLEVADFMTALEVSCRETDVVRHIDFDEILASLSTGKRTSKNPAQWKVSFSHAGQRMNLGVVPDKIFALESNRKPGDRAYFFLEVDRATMPVFRNNPNQTSFFQKMLAYEATWQQRLHEKHFSFHRFRVVTVTTSSERVENLIRATGRLAKGKGLFLFTHKHSLPTTTNLLTLPFQTARSGETISLSE